MHKVTNVNRPYYRAIDHKELKKHQKGLSVERYCSDEGYKKTKNKTEQKNKKNMENRKTVWRQVEKV